jgi:hypothetical protein
MIVVEADLWPGGFLDWKGENLCRVEIVNDGTGTRSRGNYDVRLFARNNGRMIRTARVENWPRNSRPAWRLIQAALEALG